MCNFPDCRSNEIVLEKEDSSKTNDESIVLETVNLASNGDED